MRAINWGGVTIEPTSAGGLSSSPALGEGALGVTGRDNAPGSRRGVGVRVSRLDRPAADVANNIPMTIMPMMTATWVMTQGRMAEPGHDPLLG
jgi:hypothetical protein